MRALDRTVLVGNPGVVAGRLHPVMLAQRIIARGQISAGIAFSQRPSGVSLCDNDGNAARAP